MSKAMTFRFICPGCDHVSEVESTKPAPLRLVIQWATCEPEINATGLRGCGSQTLVELKRVKKAGPFGILQTNIKFKPSDRFVDLAKAGALKHVNGGRVIEQPFMRVRGMK